MKEGSPNNTKTISKSLTRIGQFPACSAAHSHCKSDSTNFPGVLPVDCLHLTFQFEGRRSSRSPSSMVPSSLESTSMQRRDQGCSAHASSELLLCLLRSIHQFRVRSSAACCSRKPRGLLMFHLETSSSTMLFHLNTQDSNGSPA